MFMIRYAIGLATAILLVFAATAPGGADIAGKTVVFLPFYDESGYRGPWDLANEVPVMLGDMLGGADDYFTVVPMDTVLVHMPAQKKPNIFSRTLNLFLNQKRQRYYSDAEALGVARDLGADFVITGAINNFNFTRRGGGEPMIGGYKRFVSSVKVEQVRIIRVVDGLPLGTVRGEETKTAGGLGLELLGKPRDMDLEFYSLDSLDFGSKRYLGTLMGQTTVEALNKVNHEIRTVIAKPDSNWYAARNFRVLTIDRGNVIINAGSSDGVNAGDRFVVFTADSGVRVGKLNVVAIMSEHIARCEILEGQDEIRPDDRIMPEM